jgi:hypothetical protein
MNRDVTLYIATMSNDYVVSHIFRTKMSQKGDTVGTLMDHLKPLAKTSHQSKVWDGNGYI